MLLLALVAAHWYMVADPLPYGTHETHHFELYGKDAPGYDADVLKGVDKVQSTAMDGGGYLASVTADPPESPIGYPLTLFGKPILAPTRPTSYCSGSSYAAFLESLNVIFENGGARLSADRLEELRMQEPDGGRRNDFVKVWGTWNADGPGSEFALVQYTGMGERIKPEDARPGDFMNINWKSGLGHSVVFLGWCANAKGEKSVLYWSSQTSTNGYGDRVSPLRLIKSVVIVRMTHPEKLFTFNPPAKIDRSIEGDTVDLP